jgi:hypothetical protein
MQAGLEIVGFHDKIVLLRRPCLRNQLLIA